MNSSTPAEGIKLIVGLGNPGAQYKNTRHNIGFLVIDALADVCGAVWLKKDIAYVADIMLNNKKIILVKPQTYMNSSGKALTSYAKKGIKPENIMVIHDELEKPFGSVVIKQGGSHKGHNGVRSIIDCCGIDFFRLRCGIGRPTNKDDVPDYVLSNFDELPFQVEDMIEKAVELIQEMC